MEFEKLKKDTIGTIIEYIDNTMKLTGDVVIQLQTGNDQNIYALMHEITEGLQLILEAMELTKDLHHIDFVEMNPALGALLESMQNEDFVSVSDILEYEIAEILMKWKEKLNKYL